MRRAQRHCKRAAELATAYNRLKRTEDAEREKAIVDRLNAEAQAKQKGKGGSPPS